MQLRKEEGEYDQTAFAYMEILWGTSLLFKIYTDFKINIEANIYLSNGGGQGLSLLTKSILGLSSISFSVFTHSFFSFLVLQVG